ncbi:MAG: His-Xaa-Ser system protein HxsD [Elusimicrobiota bacterium]
MKEFTVEVNAALYGVEAVYKACYRFLESMYVRLEGDPEKKIIVRLRPKDESVQTEHFFVGEFENELLHQALRLKVAANNGKIREYIVTRALASAEGAPAGFEDARESENSSTRAPTLDAELEKEIEKLLAEVEREGGDDPLKIVAPHAEPQSASLPLDKTEEKGK